MAFDSQSLSGLFCLNILPVPAALGAWSLPGGGLPAALVGYGGSACGRHFNALLFAAPPL